MEIKIDNTLTPVTAHISGRLDTTYADMVPMLLRPLSDYTGQPLVVDCAGLSYISSSGLRLFLTLLKEVKAKGGSLTLRNMRPEILDVFRLTGFLRIFTVE